MYKIIIEKITEYNMVDKDWKQVADTGNERDDGAVYDYVETEVTRTKNVTVLEQCVDELDLTAVIKAVNKIE